MRPATQGFLILCAVVLCIGGIITMVGKSAWDGMFTTTEIKMVQPWGFAPQRDSTYAEHVNVPNSEANLNNAQAEKNLAQATAIVSQAQVITGQVEQNGVAKGLPLGVLLTCLAGGILILIIVGVVMVVSRAGVS